MTSHVSGPLMQVVSR